MLSALSGKRTGGRRRTESALIKGYVTTSDWGLRLMSEGGPLCSREPASDAQLFPSNPNILSNFLLFAQRRAREHLLPAAWTHTAPSPTPSEAQEPRGRERGWHLSPMAFGNSLSWGRPPPCAVSSSLPCIGGVRAALWAPTDGPATQPCSVADWLTMLFESH